MSIDFLTHHWEQIIVRRKSIKMTDVECKMLSYLVIYLYLWPVSIIRNERGPRDSVKPIIKADYYFWSNINFIYVNRILGIDFFAHILSHTYKNLIKNLEKQIFILYFLHRRITNLFLLQTLSLRGDVDNTQPSTLSFPERLLGVWDVFHKGVIFVAIWHFLKIFLGSKVCRKCCRQIFSIVTEGL